uniref:Uncharacterized protein n=1 Tax=Ditylenchus dipsaci TaxID=166011 RepID=A0A915D9J5_9BILA
MSSKTSDVVAVNCHEYETQYFGFSSRGFINFYYNEFISAWAQVVEDVLMPSILQGEQHDKSAVKNLRDKLLNRLFQHGKLDLILKKAQEHAVKYIFKVPTCVTLPSDRLNLELQHYDEQELLAKIERYRKEILEMRLSLNI